MAKKGKKKSFYKKNVKPLISGNQILLAGLAGAATGIALANILGGERAKQIVDHIGNSVKDFSEKLKNELSNHSFDQSHTPAKPGINKKITTV